jgi:glycosyltransferase involved in cell wall biosynthesis
MYAQKYRPIIYIDNHSDFTNSGTNWVSKNILHKMLWKICAHIIEPYAKLFYGVLPARVDFLKHVYSIAADKCELLVMGADDELVQVAAQPDIRKRIREKYHIDTGDFLVLSGGKIDKFKTQTLLLMDAVSQINNANLKLVLFGSVVQDLKIEVEKRCSDRVQYIGWVKSEESYPLFAAADLACFPGRHSVFWEQVTGQGIPMLVKYWDGTTHVDLGGNVEFLYQDSVDEIKEKLLEIVGQPKYHKMKSVAVEKGMDVFSYRKIAERSIEVNP